MYVYERGHGGGDDCQSLHRHFYFTFLCIDLYTSIVSFLHTAIHRWHSRVGPSKRAGEFENSKRDLLIRTLLQGSEADRIQIKNTNSCVCVGNLHVIKRGKNKIVFFIL